MKIPEGKRVFIQEVCPRDGFQIETAFIPTAQKVQLINSLSRTGLAGIEVTSFTSAKAVPNLADAETVMQEIDRVPGVDYIALVPNLRGCERSLLCRPDVINFVMSASESHNLANLRMTCARSLEQLASIVDTARARSTVSASISTAFGCPFEGEVAVDRVLRLVEAVTALGIGRVSLCDTTGMAHPLQVWNLFAEVIRRWPKTTFTAHFHNTRSMGLANAVAALEAGIDHFDSSLGGLGGCPYAPGANGNVCTEDLVHMFALMDYQTGIDLPALVELARELPAIVGHEVPGQLIRSGLSSRRYPMPAWILEREANNVAQNTIL